VWRDFDGPEFCNLAHRFFGGLNAELLAEESITGEDAVRFASEMAVINRSFSARWFNACARKQIPERGSIRWYLGHCLGKLDLEFSRELSTWQEPAGNPWRRKPAEISRLDL
jgi:hypothetical protein